MPAWNKVGASEDGSQASKRQSGGRSSGGSGGGGGGRDDDEDPDRRRRREGQRDQRTPEEKQADIERRLNSQCRFRGWFDSDPEYKRRTGRTFQYRQCREHASVNWQPWCKSHKWSFDDDRDDDPNGKPKKEQNFKSGRKQTKHKGLGEKGLGPRDPSPGPPPPPSGPQASN